MITEFKLAGLSKPKSMTCYTKKEVIFWPKVEMAQDRFDALFVYCKHNWQDEKVVEIEHDGFYEDGTPINPVVKTFKEL